MILSRTISKTMSSENQERRGTNQEFIAKKQRFFISPMAETSSSSSSYNGSSSVMRIPHDHLFSILLLLPVESILCFAMTCKKLKSLAYSDSLWESICKRDWGQIPVDALKGSNRLHQFHWKKLYQQVYQLESVFCTRLLSENPDDVPEILPIPRASHSLNLVSGCLVLFGGGCEGGRHCDDTWVAHIGNNFKRTLKWQKIASGIPSGRFGHSCIVINDCLILFGGINDNGVRQNDTWVGRVAVHEKLGITLSWRLLDIGSTAPPPPPRGAHAGCSFDSKRMLIHGGIGPSGLRLGDTWILNLSDDLCFGRWAQVVGQQCPPSRSGHTLTHIGEEQSILFGGRGVGYQVLHDVWLLDGGGASSEGHWRWTQLMFELHSVPQGFNLPRVGHSANLIVGRRLLVYGGEDSNRRRKDDFWVLDIGSMGFGRVQNRNRVYRKMWKRVESEGEKPNCRSFHGACVDDSGRFLYVHGGMVDGVVVPTDPSGLRFDGESYVVEIVVVQP